MTQICHIVPQRRFLQRCFLRLCFLPVCLWLTAALPPAVAAKEIIPAPASEPVLGELEPVLIHAMLKGENNNASLDGSFATVRNQAALQAQLKKHNLQLFGGPMLGCVTPTSIKVWLRTVKEARVRVVVQTGAGEKHTQASQPVDTTNATDLTAVLTVNGLQPGTAYTYRIEIDGKPAPVKNAKFNTAPQAGQPAKFDVAFGGGARLVPAKERIWSTIAKRNPLAVLMLGDNLYMDMPTHRNLQRLYYYRRQLRPEFQQLSASSAFYAIWDDHDFGKNDTQGGPETFSPPWKLPVYKVFRENWVNPYYGGGDKQPGCWFDFSIGDVDFFMTDGRYYRDFKNKPKDKRSMLGPVQKKWLLEKLSASKAKFKVIASGTLWTEHADKGGADSWWGAPAEREEIFSHINRGKIDGVILLSADRHRSDIYKIERPQGYPLYEFETSKLTNNHTHKTRDKALFSYNKGNFYGMLTFDTTQADPQIMFRCITIDDKVIHTMKLRLSEISHAAKAAE